MKPKSFQKFLPITQYSRMMREGNFEREEENFINVLNTAKAWMSGIAEGLLIYILLPEESTLFMH